MTILPTLWAAGEFFANVLKGAFSNLRTFGTFVCLVAFGCANLTFSESIGLIIKLGTTSRARELCAQKSSGMWGLNFRG